MVEIDRNRALLWFLILLAGLFAPVNAFATPFSNSGIGTWNGFNDHVNVIECRNLSHIPAKASLSLFDFTGASVGKREISVSAFSVSHIILNDFAINNSYGTFSIAIHPSDLGSTSLACDTFLYREKSGEVEYVETTPVNKSVVGVTGGIFNTANPSATDDLKIFNWLTIYNTSAQTFRAAVNVYDFDGVLDPSQSFTVDLTANERTDIRLGTTHAMGLYRIVPESDSESYGAYVSRYALASNDTFRFAFSLNAEQGKLDSGLIPLASEGSNFSWIEVANPGSEGAVLQADILSSNGEIVAGMSAGVAPRGQVHLPIHEIVKGVKDAAYVRIQSEKPVVVHDIVYGFQENDFLNWAFVAAAAEQVTDAQTMALSFNTYLNAANEISLAGTTDSDTATATLNLFGEGDVISILSETIASNEIFAVDAQVGENRVGQVLVDLPKNFGVGLTRRYRDGNGNVQYVIRLTADSLEATSPDDGSDPEDPTGPPSPPDVFVEDTCFSNAEFSESDLATGVICTQTSPTDSTTFYFQHTGSDCKYRRELSLSGPFAGKKLVQIQMFSVGSTLGSVFTYSDFMGAPICQNFSSAPMGPTQMQLSTLINFSSNPQVATSCHVASADAKFDTAPLQALCH